MIQYPDINPIAVSIGPLTIYWYGLMYLFALLSAWGLCQMRARALQGWDANQVNDLIFYAAIGIVVGGRLGYMVFYDTADVFSLTTLKLWQGGMSFHGGLIGVLLAMVIFAKRFEKAYLTVTDFIAPIVPIGLAFGRLGNFINGELWGRPTDVPWAMVFNHVDALPRHPSQLYEFVLEGIVLSIILNVYAQKKPAPTALSAAFLLGYSIFRFLIEFTREPDAQLGYILFDWMTMGQLLCIPMFALGAYLVWRAKVTQLNREHDGSICK